jgi:hypothetical protein
VRGALLAACRKWPARLPESPDHRSRCSIGALASIVVAALVTVFVSAFIQQVER